MADPVPSRALTIPLTCPHCGDTLRWRQSSRPTATEASAIMACDCGEVTQVLVRLLRVQERSVEAEYRRRYRQRERERASA